MHAPEVLDQGQRQSRSCYRCCQPLERERDSLRVDFKIVSVLTLRHSHFKVLAPTRPLHLQDTQRALCEQCDEAEVWMQPSPKVSGSHSARAGSRRYVIKEYTRRAPCFRCRRHDVPVGFEVWPFGRMPVMRAWPDAAGMPTWRIDRWRCADAFDNCVSLSCDVV